MTPFTLKALPYPAGALSPVISERTVLIHHGKHQAGYADKLNQLIRSTRYAHDDLEMIMFHTKSERNEQSIFNNAAQLWNHEFFWESLAPEHALPPSSLIAQRLSEAFGSVDAFRAQMIESAAHHFGSGWVWLSRSREGELSVDCTHDADNPLLWGGRPLFVCDLWEHAYYLDYQQDRAGFVRAVLDRLINWPQIQARFERLQNRDAALA